MAGRWQMRINTGAEILRGDLRLEQRGSTLAGTLSLETSDGPPVPITGGRVGPGGEFSFSADPGETMRLAGRRDGAELSGQVALERGRSWQWSAQPLADGAEFYAALPRFRAAQLVIGRNLTELALPGAWMAAADSQGGIEGRAAALAQAAGLPPIPADSLLAYGVLPALGVAQRDEMVAVMTSALAAIRATLPAASQDGFDALFRPHGAWLVDLHDAALAAARRRISIASWETARPALAAAGLLPSKIPPDVALVPYAIYRLAVLRARDSASDEITRERLRLGGQVSARVTGALLDGYREAAVWQGQAVAFLLTAPWVDATGGRTSLAGLVAAAWGRPDLAVPVIRPHFFGYPEAVPRIGTPGAVVERWVVPENWTGEQWVARHGAREVLGLVRQLDLGLETNATLEAGGPSILTSVAREAAARPAGFFEATSEVIEDPGMPPLYAVATAVHEWQHLLMEGYRLSLASGGAVRPDSVGLRYLPSDLFLAEGFAEWMTERIMAPVVTQAPIVEVGEARKLAFLEAGNPSDPHILGLRMLRALAAVTGDPVTVRELVLGHGDAPAEVAAAVPAWRDGGAPDRVLPVRQQRRLVPETRFTVEDRVGDVTGVWIRVTP